MSASRTVTIQGVDVPTFLYGTAWKEDRTRGLVARALGAGFRGIDTANQRRHYHEAAVGEALGRAFDDGLARDAVFLQTKYTYPEGQDRRLPYDPNADYPTQLRQSVARSLEHLKVEALDSLLLHGPRTRVGLGHEDRRVWEEMEALHAQGSARLIGVSNFAADQLAELCETAEVRPAFVQNRCFARLGWDREVRAVCAEHGVVYQGFSLLTANQAELADETVRRIAGDRGRTIAQLVFRFALQVGMIPLTGTSSRVHMDEDLSVYDFELADAEMAAIERVAG